MIGSLLNNRYRVLDELSSGGFGKTFIAEDIHMPSRRRCVVKLLHPVSHIPPNIQQVIAERFAQEAAALEYLGDSIDGVPKLYAYFEERGEFYLIQELITGKTLDDKVKTEGPYTERQCIEFLIVFLKLLGEIHSRKVIHRDIKPSNIIIRNHDQKPFLIDFGIVKEVMTVTLDSPMRSHIFGTPGYAPYEQALGKPVFATDIYSLGMSCIYLVTGKQPATMVNQLDGQIEWRGFVEGINHDFALLIDKATENDFRNRYKTAFEMLAAVNSLPPQTVPTHAPRFDTNHMFADEPRNTTAPRQRLDQRSENDSNPSAWPVLPDQQNVDEGNKPGFAATEPAVSTSRTLPLGYGSPDQKMPFLNSKGTPVGAESRPRSFVRFYTVAFTGAGLIAMVLLGVFLYPLINADKNIPSQEPAPVASAPTTPNKPMPAPIRRDVAEYYVSFAKPLDGRSRFRLHVTPRFKGYIYIYAPDENESLTPILVAQEVEADKTFQFPQTWISIDRTTRFTVVLSSTRDLPEFTGYTELQAFRARPGVEAPQESTQPSGANTITKLSTTSDAAQQNPVVFDVEVKHK